MIEKIKKYFKNIKFKYKRYKEKNWPTIKTKTKARIKILFIYLKYFLEHCLYSFFLLISLNIFKIFQNINLINYLKSVALLFIISEIADFLLNFKPVNKK